ncbi:MAG: hypothetical protein HF982_02940 [Desulfobacteraceae bacterium]|nr:hypothetical protein [Desulfobacteraceae bacterium]MBC2718540.1 hypothetical protein [Desulfobacteraceae bacterium]
MKPIQLYKNLCELAEKLDVEVSEQDLRKTGIRAKSGFCKVKGKNFFIMDKNISVQKKIRILAELLGKMPHENIYVMPAVRDILGTQN